jgi:membrane-bound lytic murein transglycosylase D
MRCVQTWLAIWIMLLPVGAALAQQKPDQPAQPAKSDQSEKSAQSDSPAQSIQQWMKDNLDDDVLQMLDQIDQDRVRDFFTKLQRQFDGTNIYELASLKEIAVQVLPVLKQFEETQPYAAWLQAHLDDLDAANEVQREMKATSPKPQTATVLPAPPLKILRSVWVKELQKRPWPPLAHACVPKLKQIFVSENVPPELVWVAGVESSFDPGARSPAGAAGMFQLMPATARTEHLSLWPFDERYQPDKSAHAAARHLRDLHNHYGDWQLALAAYNAGEGRVDNLLKKHKAGSFDAIVKWLPAETQMYVPKVEATIRLREGLALTDLKAPPA